MHLSASDCEAYYCAQVGTGDGGFFHGAMHQRGYGFFGDLRRYITPLAFRAGRYLAKNLFQTGKNVVTDVASGSSFKESARKRLRETSQSIKKDILQKLQQGQGIKRKRSAKPCQSRAKRSKLTQDIFAEL